MTPRCFTALVNPVSGAGKAAEKWAPLAHRLSAAGANVRMDLTRGRAHAVELATSAAAKGEVVVAVGGDGLVRDVAGAVVAVGGTMAIVPAGRGNDLARALGLPRQTTALAELLLHTPVRTLDVLEANGVIVPGNVYAGIDSVATQLINGNRWVPGRLIYRLAPLRAVATWHSPTYTITTDNQVRGVRAFTVVVANSGAYGHGLRIVPSALVDDGLLDVLVVGDGPRLAIGSFMRQAKKGRHVHRPEVSLRTAREVTISADRPLPFCGDGDVLGQLPATIRLRPAALQLIAP